MAARAPTANPCTVPGLVTAVKVAWPQPGWSFALERVARSALDAPLAALAVGVRLDGGRVAEARIATLASPLPRRAPQAEAALRQSQPGQFESSVTALRSEIEPADDWRASAAYRRHVTGVLLARALRRALAPGAPESP